MKNSRGFTLIELSIVLIIIALIAGGVLTGKSMLRQSKLQSIMPQTQLYIDSIKSFKEKYQYLPGDMPDATGIWGEISTGCTWEIAIGTPTCNGNGNGVIDNGQIEGFKAWQHLKNAGYILNNVTGSHASGGYLPGVNLPAANFKNVGFMIQDESAQDGTNSFAVGQYKHVLRVGQPEPSFHIRNGFISPREARRFDEKFDDGKPLTGNIFVERSGYNNMCSMGDDPITSEYSIYHDDPSCPLFFKAGF